MADNLHSFIFDSVHAFLGLSLGDQHVCTRRAHQSSLVLTTRLQCRRDKQAGCLFDVERRRYNAEDERLRIDISSMLTGLNTRRRPSRRRASPSLHAPYVTTPFAEFIGLSRTSRSAAACIFLTRTKISVAELRQRRLDDADGSHGIGVVHR